MACGAASAAAAIAATAESASLEALLREALSVQHVLPSFAVPSCWDVEEAQQGWVRVGAAERVGGGRGGGLAAAASAAT